MRTQPNLFVHDMLLHTPERPGAELFSPEVLATEGRERALAERAVQGDLAVDEPAAIDDREFDAVVGNPPYGARKPRYKEAVYRRLFGTRAKDRAVGSVATGDADSYSMFFISGIERLREGGRLCLITNDSFRSLITHAPLRRYILDRCKIVEILLTDTHHFEGVGFQFAGMAITTLEKCADASARAANEMRLVDSIRDPHRFASPPPEKVATLRQEEYEALPETPFFVGVPREVFESAKASGRVRDVARGRQGLATADDKRFVAGIDQPFAGLPTVVPAAEVISEQSDDERAHGIAAYKPHWVPFAKGEGFGDYWRPAQVAIDWSEQSVAELERRNRLSAGTARKTYFRNREWFFRPGLTYSVISSGRVSARLLPEGWIFGHKGSAIFTEEGTVDELFLLGYLNSSLATYFMKKLVNTTATADIGYVEKLPFRRPDSQTESHRRCCEADGPSPQAGSGRGRRAVTRRGRRRHLRALRDRRRSRRSPAVLPQRRTRRASGRGSGGSRGRGGHRVERDVLARAQPQAVKQIGHRVVALRRGQEVEYAALTARHPAVGQGADPVR